MLNRSRVPAADPQANSTPGQASVSGSSIHRQLGDADDEKINKIIAYVDQFGDAAVNRTLLDPLRARLAALRPSRALRLSRLLFIPLDPLIVSPAVWRPGSLRVPRTTLAPLTAAVTARLGTEASRIAGMVGKLDGDAAETIEQAGALLWPRAADILADAPVPPEWRETELPEALFGPLARRVAAVIRRGSLLQGLVRDGEQGRFDDDAANVAAIMAGLVNESADGAAMVAQLVLIQAPHAVLHLRRFVSATRDSAESIALNKAMSLGVEQTLQFLEREANFARKINTGSIGDAGDTVRSVAKLLYALDSDTSAPVHRARLRAMRDGLDRASRACFAKSLKSDIIEPLAAMRRPDVVVEQRRLEVSARELRALESTARHFGDPAGYDCSLLQTSEAVRAAYAAGTIGLARACRLIEILSGPESAIELYHSAARDGGTA